MDRMIHDSAVREAEKPVAEILGDLRSIIGSRRPEAARDAADRVWTMRFPPRPGPLPHARLVATDVEWTRGAGEEISGPISALLLLLTGRTEAATPRLTGAQP